MTSPRFTLVTDGPTDGVMLVPVLEWLLSIHCPRLSSKVTYADSSQSWLNPRRLEQRISFALQAYPCECLFIHRDAEREPPANRRHEIHEAIRLLGADRPPACVCVVPVRMSEAWLLLDESAIRRAAENPNGKVPMDMPRRADIEGLPDPKKRLYELLKTAANLNTRRSRRYDPKVSARFVTRYSDDFSGLRELSAFRTLEEDVQRIAK